MSQTKQKYSIHYFRQFDIVRKKRKYLFEDISSNFHVTNYVVFAEQNFVEKQKYCFCNFIYKNMIIAGKKNNRRMEKLRNLAKKKNKSDLHHILKYRIYITSAPKIDVLNK